MARERTAGSVIDANADGGCNGLEGCADPETDAASIMQHSKAIADPDRMCLMPPPRGNLSRRQKFISLRQNWRGLESSLHFTRAELLALLHRTPDAAQMTKQPAVAILVIIDA